MPAGPPDAGPARATLDLLEPMALAAHAIVHRLDPAQGDRPWFKLRGEGGIPAALKHDTWDFGDMTGRYLEGLILARHMGITDPALSDAEGRLGRYLLKILGPDGQVRRTDSAAAASPSFASTPSRTSPAPNTKNGTMATWAAAMWRA